MSVPILDASAWREYRGKPANSGVNATTHMAKVVGADVILTHLPRFR